MGLVQFVGDTGGHFAERGEGLPVAGVFLAAVRAGFEVRLEARGLGCGEVVVVALGEQLRALSAIHCTALPNACLRS